MTVRELGHGEAGADVMALQETLLHLGYTEVGSPDGAFGNNTGAAVKRFQAENGLDPSGVVDSWTRGAIVASATVYGLTNVFTEEGRDALHDAHTLAHGEAGQQHGDTGPETAQMPEGAALSEDGHWWWDGAQWQPVSEGHSGAPASEAPTELAGLLDDHGVHAGVSADSGPSLDPDARYGNYILRSLLTIGDLYGELRNGEANGLLRKVAAADDQDKELAKVLDEVAYIEKVYLPDQLRLVEDAAHDIAKRARKNPDLRKAIVDHSKESPEVRTQVKRAQAAHKRVVAASKGLDIALSKKQLRAAAKDVKDKQTKVTDIEQKAAELRGRVGKVVESAELLIGDPTKYKDLMGEAAQFLKDKAIDFVLGDVYEAELKEAEAALAKAKEQVEGITAAIETKDIEKATAELEAAQLDHSASLEQLESATNSAATSEGGLVQQLEDLGGRAEQVADAIGSRAATAKTVEHAKALITNYVAQCDEIQRRAKSLRLGYQDYATRIQQMTLTWPLVMHRDELHSRAVGNQSVVDDITTYSQTEETKALAAKRHLDSGDILKFYEQMEKKLQKALSDV